MIPIYIIARDRKECLIDLCNWLTKIGHERVTVIDNGSSYEPLLDWYDTECPFPIHRINENGGHMIPWNGNIVPRDEYYCVTDCDVVPDENCPDDAIGHLKDLLDKHADYFKVGFSLRIDDIPAHYKQSNEVKNWEKQFWYNNIGDGFDAPIDTTFAMYRPFDGSWDLRAIRSLPPYQARHLGWYVDNNNLPPDIKWYQKNMNKHISDWTKKL